jgi:AcrR family transcriptional regulator
LKTRDKILETALRQFEHQGFEKTSIAQIAARLGITKAAIYYHFPSKEALVRETSEPYFRALDDFLSRGDPTVDELVTVLIDHQMIVRWLARDASALSTQLISRRLSKQGRELRQFLVGDTKAEEGKVRAAAAMGCLLRPILDLKGVSLRKHSRLLVTMVDAVVRESSAKR